MARGSRRAQRSPQRVRKDAPAGSKAKAIDREPNAALKVLGVLGPGLITGAAQMDPSAIATYAVAGAKLGLSPLWTALYTMPLVVVAEATVARIGLVTRRGLAEVLRERVPRPVLLVCVALVAIATTINLGADLGAIGEGAHMLTGLPVQPFTIPAALITAGLVVFGSYRKISTVFKVLTLALLAYVVTAFFVRPQLSELAAATFIPHLALDRDALQVIVAVLGTTISPYLLFWQSDEEVEEKKQQRRARGRRASVTSEPDIAHASLDVGAGMFSANAVMFCIMLTTALTLYASGRHDVKSGADAAEALRPLLGDLASTLFAIGLIGAGLLAVPVLAGSASYAVAETFGWKTGLDRGWRGAPRFYAVYLGATAAGTLLNFTGINPIDALFLTSLVMGVISPPLLAVTIVVARQRRVMKNERIGPWMTAIGVAAVVVMTLAALGALWTVSAS